MTTFVVAVFAISVGRIHFRVQTTLVGYELGKLKENEAVALEQQSTLKMQLAKLTTQKHLRLMAGTLEDEESGKQLAVNH